MLMSEAAGISTQKLAEFQGAIRLAGGNADAAGASLSRLARGIEQNARGVGQFADDFKRLGVTSKDPIEAFMQMSDTIHDLANKGEALGAAEKIVGRSAIELVGIMGQGSAAFRERMAASRGTRGCRDGGNTQRKESDPS